MNMNFNQTASSDRDQISAFYDQTHVEAYSHDPEFTQIFSTDVLPNSEDVELANYLLYLDNDYNSFIQIANAISINDSKFQIEDSNSQLADSTPQTEALSMMSSTEIEQLVNYKVSNNNTNNNFDTNGTYGTNFQDQNQSENGFPHLVSHQTQDTPRITVTDETGREISQWQQPTYESSTSLQDFYSYDVALQDPIPSSSSSLILGNLDETARQNHAANYPFSESDQPEFHIPKIEESIPDPDDFAQYSLLIYPQATTVAKNIPIFNVPTSSQGSSRAVAPTVHFQLETKDHTDANLQPRTNNSSSSSFSLSTSPAMVFDESNPLRSSRSSRSSRSTLNSMNSLDSKGPSFTEVASQGEVASYFEVVRHSDQVRESEVDRETMEVGNSRFRVSPLAKISISISPESVSCLNCNIDYGNYTGKITNKIEGHLALANVYVAPGAHESQITDATLIKLYTETKELSASSCIHQRTKYDREIDELHNSISNIVYKTSSKYSLDMPYEPQYLRFEVGPDSRLVMASKSGLCPYCEEVRFLPFKNSSYLSHLTLEHGVFSNGYLTPDGLYFGSYKLKKNSSRNNQEHTPSGRERQVEALMCPLCFDMVEFGCWEGKKNKLLSYFRHFKNIHGQHTIKARSSQIPPIQDRGRTLHILPDP
ncbi:predicted protein [Scheffersomyces stipitis CBS 6054]|uniref:Transcription regulator Rua1 C-terminal domain-containing protein n=1 Tax=Scheffersomyces stipitis (strain ATCC 58785 / CBS 6054 / NBRC 10063 / NRRL Y-11545) TaxID=322104 RepID=A3LT98_PICST|nr:predicted protein [Scheffersomyces stipitis CBS 6054]ABN66370.2 predicted protein [Scheffersomyces stipitis CBS 6054]KAG2733224.1 hypothetical protein G9P44_004214 [Scheffersomyces stipitis]